MLHCVREGGEEGEARATQTVTAEVNARADFRDVSYEHNKLDLNAACETLTVPGEPR